MMSPPVVKRISIASVLAEHAAIQAVETQETPAALSGCEEHPDRSAERIACADQRTGFAHFIKHWWFVNRDTGQPMRFNRLWPGQENVVDLMTTEPWLILLKAGKLGFSEMECAYDGWVALYRHQNARVHIFSMDAKSAKSFLAIVKFGLTHVPEWLGLPIMVGEPGADTTTSLKLYGGPDDVRSIWSYPSNKDAAIDQVATHSHVDELARMPWPAETMSAVQSTVAPGGSIHVVSRGQGDGNYLTTLYRAAEKGGSPFYAHFEPFQSRPRVPQGEVPPGADPNEVWYAQQQESGMPAEQLNWLAPRTADDALKGSGEGAFIPESIWLSCYDPGLPVLMPGDRTPIVLSLDAGVTNDLFAAVAVSRHPDHEPHPDYPCSRTTNDPAIRAVQVWRPPANGEIDFDEVERWVRFVCLGGCFNGHPNAVGVLSHGFMCAVHPDMRHRHRVDGTMAGCDGAEMPCSACDEGLRTPAFNVVQVVYDAYQLVDMAQHLTRDRVAWCLPFGQGGDRLEADGNLRIVCYQRRLAHRNDATLNEHVRNANAKMASGEDTKLRLVKRAPDLKIDAAVATSMGVAQVLYLVLENAR